MRRAGARRTPPPRWGSRPVRGLLAATLAAALGLGGARAQTPATEGWLALRVLDLDAARGPVDVWLDDARILAAVAAGEPTPYVLVPADTQRIEVAAARDDGGPAGGGDADAESDAAEADDAEAEGEARRTAYALGSATPGSYLTLLLPPGGAGPEGEGDAAGEGEAAGAGHVLLDDPLAALPPAGRAGLRLVHAAPGAGRVALVRRDPDLRYEAPPPFEPSDDAGSGHLTRLGPLEASDWAMLPEGDTALWLVREDGEPVLAEPLEAPLRAGTLYTLYLVPDDDGAVRGRLAIDATAPAPPGREE